MRRSEMLKSSKATAWPSRNPNGSRTVPVRSGRGVRIGLTFIVAGLTGAAAADGDRPRSGYAVLGSRRPSESSDSRPPVRALITLCAIALVATALPAAAAPARVRLATLAPKGSSFHQAIQAMGEKWRHAPGGGVALTIFTDGSMGGEADMVRKMRIGQLQAAMLTASGLAEIDKSVTALQLMPLMFRNWEEVDYVREKLRPRLEQTMRDKGFVVLFWGDGGWVRWFSKQPLRFPEDLRKMKVFATVGGTETIDIMKGMGLSPVPLEVTDILPGLQTGLINAVPTPPVYANAAQLFNHAPYMLELDWVPLVGGAVIDVKTWNKLAPATQKSLQEAAEETGEKIRARSRKENDEAVEAMKKRGLKAQPVTPEIAAAWQKVAGEVYPIIRGKIVPADMFDEVQRLLNERRASAPKGKASGKTGESK